MSRPRRRPTLDQDLVVLLARAPAGLSSPALQRALAYSVSQPTLSRALTRLRATGDIVALGEARARVYCYAGGRLGAAELRSLRLHEVAARALIADPTLRKRATARLKQLKRANPQGASYQARWATLLADLSLEGEARLLRLMTEDSESAATLRRESPFTVLVPRAVRDRLFRPSTGRA